MSKKKTSFNDVFHSMFEFVTAHVSSNPDKPNGFSVKKKKEVKAACCHIMLRDSGKGGMSSEPILMLKDDPVAGTSHCVICDRTFESPDINQDNLAVLQHAARILNGFVALLPWSDAGKEDARLALETRNLMEKTCILYESALNNISTAKVGEVDTTMKSHATHL